MADIGKLEKPSWLTELEKEQNVTINPVLRLNTGDEVTIEFLDEPRNVKTTFGLRTVATVKAEDGKTYDFFLPMSVIRQLITLFGYQLKGRKVKISKPVDKRYLVTPVQ